MLSRQFYTGLAIGLGAGLQLAALLVEQGLVSQRSRSWLMGLAALSATVAIVLLLPPYRRSPGGAANGRAGDFVDNPEP